MGSMFSNPHGTHHTRGQGTPMFGVFVNSKTSKICETALFHNHSNISCNAALVVLRVASLSSCRILLIHIAFSFTTVKGRLRPRHLMQLEVTMNASLRV